MTNGTPVYGTISNSGGIFSLHFAVQKSPSGGMTTSNLTGHSPDVFKNSDVPVVDFTSVETSTVFDFLGMTDYQTVTEAAGKPTISLEDFLALATQMGITILNSKKVYLSWQEELLTRN